MTIAEREVCFDRLIVIVDKAERERDDSLIDPTELVQIVARLRAEIHPSHSEVLRQIDTIGDTFAMMIGRSKGTGLSREKHAQEIHHNIAVIRGAWPEETNPQKSR